MPTIRRASRRRLWSNGEELPLAWSALMEAALSWASAHAEPWLRPPRLSPPPAGAAKKMCWVLGHPHSRDRVADLGQLMKDYYFVKGWDADGIPTEKKLRELGIYMEVNDVQA